MRIENEEQLSAFRYGVRPGALEEREHGICCVECYGNGVTQGEHTGTAVESERILSLLEDYAENETWSWNDLLRKIKEEL